jgi:hypothetical protein
VNHGVGTAEDPYEVGRRDVRRGERRAGERAARRAARHRDDLVDLCLGLERFQQARPHVSGGADHDDSHGLLVPGFAPRAPTLIAEEEDITEAREDAREAIVGACALVLFAAVAALTFGHVPGGVVLLASTLVWLATAVLGYVVLW